MQNSDQERQNVLLCLMSFTMTPVTNDLTKYKVTTRLLKTIDSNTNNSADCGKMTDYTWPESHF